MRYDRGYGRFEAGRPRGRYGEEYRGRGGDRGVPIRGGGRRYGGDYWWIGEHELDRYGRGVQRYDEAYRRFGEANRPRFSPVGGMYGAVGGSYAARRLPRPIRESSRFSDWTRWF